jgi:hypothetical protein
MQREGHLRTPIQWPALLLLLQAAYAGGSSGPVSRLRRAHLRMVSVDTP